LCIVINMFRFAHRTMPRAVLYVIFLTGLAVFIVPHFWLNKAISGSFMPLSQQYQAYLYPGSYLAFEQPAGKFAHSSLPDMLIYWFHVLFGIRGLFSYTPLLLFGLFKLVSDVRSSDTKTRSLSFWSLVGIVVLVVTVLLITSNFGGSAYGVRWFLPFSPLLVINCGLWLNETELRTGHKVALVLLISISFLTAVVGTIEPWTQLHGNNWTFYNNLMQFWSGLG